MDTRKIARDYDLRVIHLNKNNFKRITDQYNIDKKDAYENAFIFDDEVIILGIYKNKHHKVAAFFHEIGHSLIKESFEKLVNNDIQLIEYQAWIEGLKIAKKYKEKIEPATFEYILKSINSYYKSAINVYNKKSKQNKETKKSKKGEKTISENRVKS